jgi:nitroimidazol reductase NimA-like FMN-containing flavoprotein (pyridoxamine 5'-phosphate oxidase superfamily)
MGTMGLSPFDLAHRESIELLEKETVGRLCVIEHGYPLAFPISYRLTRTGDQTKVAFRTVPHSTVARYEGPACLEVDRIDTDRQSAWSVIVRGDLRRAFDQGDLPDTFPLVTEGRHQWVVLEVTAISGRRFTSTPADDGFSVEWQPADTAMT